MFQEIDVPAGGFQLHCKKRLEAEGEQKITPVTRSITLIFENETEKWEFVKRVNTGLKQKNIFCKLDMCQEVRNQEWALREQIRE